jgi:hypothetical protein
MLGVAGVVRLWPAVGGTGGREGWRRFAAAARLPYRGTPAAAGLGNATDGAMARFPVIDGVERLILLADNDLNHAGQVAAEACKQRWQQAGRSGVLLMPNRPGTDFNDIVLESLGRVP